jgi:histone demethylase JARID1
MHSGSPKTWYGVSALYSDAFEETLASKRAQNVFASTDELLTSITNMMSPIHLVSKNVPVYRLVQEPRTFVVTFPQAYHSGFSHGLNLSEACNLALPDWIPYGRKAVERYSQSSSFRTSLFAHDQLVCSLAQDYKSHSPYIVDELTRIINAEELGRQKAIHDGLVILVQLKNSYDLRGECYFCRSICYLSCVVCRCEKTRNPNRVVSCLKHIPSLCSCDPSEKVLCYWYTIQSLRSLLGVISKKSDCDKR